MARAALRRRPEARPERGSPRARPAEASREPVASASPRADALAMPEMAQPMSTEVDAWPRYLQSVPAAPETEDAAMSEAPTLVAPVDTATRMPDASDAGESDAGVAATTPDREAPPAPPESRAEQEGAARTDVERRPQPIPPLPPPPSSAPAPESVRVRGMPPSAQGLIDRATASAASAGESAQGEQARADADEADAQSAETQAAATDEAAGDESVAAQSGGESEGAAEAPAAGGARGGSARAGGLDLGGDEPGGDEALPEQLAAQEEITLRPPGLAWQALSAQWLAPAALSPDALALPAPPSASSATAAPQGGGKPQPAAPAKAPAEDGEQRARNDREARDTTQRAYLDLVRDSRREQDAFVERANRIAEEMSSAYGSSAAEIVQGHERDQRAVDQAEMRAVTEVENAASFAQMSLQSASFDAAAAIEAAGRGAYGLINADDTTAAQRIGEVVSGLVSGHVAAYTGAIGALTEASETALLELNTWRDERSTNYPTDGNPVDAAKNESRQSRIPGWVDLEATRLDERVTAKTTEWAGSRDTTVCGLSCSYRGALETERQRVNTEGKASVARSLASARQTLREQTRNGKRALADLRLSYLQQVRTQSRAAKSRLNSQARAAIDGLHGESQGAVGGVQGAARGAMPTYWRGAAGFEQSLRGAAPKGAQALRQTAERAPTGILLSAQRAGAQLDERLQGNLSRLQESLAERSANQDQQSAQQVMELESTLAQQSTQAATGFDQSLGNFQTAFGGLSDTVSQAAASWAQPLAVRMAGFIAGKQGEAQAALSSLLRGQSPTTAGGGGGGGGEGGGDAGGDAGGGASCGECATAAGPGGASATPAAAPGGGAGGAGASGPQGLTAQADAEIAYANERGDPETLFAQRLTEVGTQVQNNLDARATNVARKFEGGWNGTVDEEGVIAVLRGLTPLKGAALDTVSYPAVGGGTLDSHLQHYLGADSGDYATASAYLRGDAREGARLELLDSVGIFNDDEARIEATMRALSPEDLAALGQDPQIMDDVRGALDGTDKQVFDALIVGDYAGADAYRMRDAVDAARRDGNADAVHSAIELYTGAPGETDWRSTQEMSADDRRTAVVAALGNIVSDADVARGARGADVASMSAEDRAVAYVTRDIDVYVSGGPEGEPQQVTLSITGANRDLAGALLRHGERSVEARAARLGVEMQRTGDPPNALNIDRATFDERFNPDNPNATPEERAANERARVAARADRARMLLLAAQYAPADGSTAAPPAADHDAVMRPDFAPDPAQVGAARASLIAGLRGRFGDDTIGADLAAGLLTDERPSPRTASLAMQHAMYSHAGTNEELLFRFTERMNRDEIAAMRTQFQADTGKSLDAELGVYGEGGTFTELSGDDRLRMERAMRGVARTDTERLENAAFALAQQRRETGGLGAWLAEDTLANRVMTNTEHRLETLAGGPIALTRRGDLIASLPNFDPHGTFTGPDRDAFLSTISVAQTVAENYSKRIDAFADVATTGIAILGAIAAAAITVATGGAAGPLIAAAVITGLASMSANYALKGGRYGWEQAAIDLGMTAVQAITAGVGAQLGLAAQVASKGAAAASAASRSLATLARLFTGNPVVDQIIIGAVTGSMGGLANTAFDERTWEHSGGDAVGALFSGLLKGALSGAATAAVTQSIEALGRNGAAIADRARAFAAQGGVLRGAVGLAGRGIGGLGRGINAGLNASAEGGFLATAGNVAGRGLTRGAISSLGGMAGRATELAYDSRTGRFKGDVGDALIDIGHAGAHAFVQGIGEGMGEAVGQSMHNRHLMGAAHRVNRAREEMGLEPLRGDPRHEGSPLRAAAEDLMFLNQHGRYGGDGLGRAINVEHVAAHGGLAATVATRHPNEIVEDGMRAELMRHVSPDQHADFAEVPIRVLGEMEYRALTRSESGPVVTLIENGHPVVVVREGTPTARLADEGPHLLQSRDTHTRERVARLDEATLARWDSLDLDTQIDLYRNKIGLEIDAHQRIHESLNAELARAHAEGTDEAHTARLAGELERNEGTLRNLRARHDEVAEIGPQRRTAIVAGDEPRPQYLEQPPRLFSKEGPEGRPRTAEEQLSDDILETMLTEIAEKRRMAARGGLVEDELQNLPDAVKAFLRRGEHMPGRSEVPHEVKAWARAVARERFGQQLQAALLDPGLHNRMTQAAMEHLSEAQLDHVRIRGELPRGVEFHHLLAVADFPEFAHLAESGTALPTEVHREAGHAMDPTRPVEAGTLLDHDALTRPIGQHNDPEARKFYRPTAREIAEGSRTTHDVDRDLAIDFQQRVRRAEASARSAEAMAQRRPTPENLRSVEAARASVAQAQQHLAEVQARIALHTEMRSELMRHLSPEMHAEFADVPIRVLPEAQYRAFTRSDAGPVVTIFVDGQPVIVVREGTHPSRLADEGPHLAQSREAHTRERVAQLDESELARWDHLDVDTQMDLYRTKVGLEIDAHERIVRSLQSETPHSEADRARVASELARAHGTLRNLRARLDEVEGIGPRRRAAMQRGEEPRPQYLDQPPRLFSKEAPGAPTRAPGYEDQPDLRGPRINAADPESREALRQRHEDWVEGIRRGFLEPGNNPRMTQGEVPAPGRPPWHESIEGAYAAYGALVREHGGRREVGIVRNADTGEFMVVLGSPTALRIPMEAMRQETVLHYHPDYGPTLYRGPSGTDLGNTAAIALETGRPVTEFIEHGVADRRGRTAFTLTPVPDSSVRGGRRLQIDIEFISPSGEYVHQRFASRAEWSEYYHARTTALDPDGPVYRDMLRAWGMTDAQIDAAAARHRAAGAPEPPAPQPPLRGRPTQAIVDPEAPHPGPGSASESAPQRTVDPRTLRKLRESQERSQRREQRTLRQAQEQRRSRAQEQAVERRQSVVDEEMARRRHALDEGRVTPEEDFQQRLVAVAAELDLDVLELGRVIRSFREDLGGGGRRYDARDVVDSLRNRIREGQLPRYGDLEGLVAQIIIEQNVEAVQQMRDHIAESRPHAVLGVERGGAFLAEVLSAGVEGFPATVAIPKEVTQRPGKPDVVRRTPHLEAEIRRRITADGESRFAIVDFYMGGVFAGELQRMIRRIRRDHPNAEFEVMWMRETHGFERLVFHPERPHPNRPTREDLEEGVVFPMRVNRSGERPTIELGPGIVVPRLKGTGENLPGVRATQFPVDVVLGDDMRAVLDRSPTEPVRIFDREGRVVQVIPVGTRDPQTGQPVMTTREIMVRLMQGARFDTREPAEEEGASQ